MATYNPGTDIYIRDTLITFISSSPNFKVVHFSDLDPKKLEALRETAKKVCLSAKTVFDSGT